MNDSVFGQTIIAYHGCDFEVGAKVVNGEIAHLAPSNNPYDWLGDGIYFFEEDLRRAQYFSIAAAAAPEKHLSAKPIIVPSAIGAVLKLGNCLDLSKQSGIDEFRQAYNDLESGKGPEQVLPVNKQSGPGDEEGILHNLDRAVINFIHGQRIKEGKLPYDTVRGFFFQGKPVFSTSAIAQLSHVQIAVRNTSCIFGYFHPQVPTADPFQGMNRLRPPPYRRKPAPSKKS
jgi:hypothetical protein